MKWRWALLGIISLVSISFTACSSVQTEKLAKNFDEKMINSTAESTITELNVGDYQKIYDAFDSTMQKALSADLLKKDTQDVVEKAGAFQSFAKENIVGVKDSKTKQDLAVDIVSAQYKYKVLTYTITFDPDMKISGLYVK